MPGGPLEGPYRDLGSGFARLAGAEGARRAPSGIRTVEDALAALVRNACEAGAERIFVASALRSRRYREITVIDDGSGIPEAFVERVFEPGVTSRHLDPAPPATTPATQDPPAAGLSLYHIRSSAVSAAVLSNAGPTSVRVVFDTHAFPERSLQTKPRSRHDRQRAARRSLSNLHATLRPFAAPRRAVYYASPSRILTTLLRTHIIQTEESSGVLAESERLGLGVSMRTVQRVVSGGVEPALRLGGEEEGPEGGPRGSRSSNRGTGAGGALRIGAEEMRRIQAILEGAARASYLAVGPLRVEARADGVVLRASVYEPEEIYDEP